MTKNQESSGFSGGSGLGLGLLYDTSSRRFYLEYHA